MFIPCRESAAIDPNEHWCPIPVPVPSGALLCVSDPISTFHLPRVKNLLRDHDVEKEAVFTLLGIDRRDFADVELHRFQLRYRHPLGDFRPVV